MFKKLNIWAIVIVAIFLLTTAFGSSLAIAEEEEGEPDRDASWHETTSQTDAWGRTWMLGQFGPDVGYGEQGTIYEYTDPMSGAYVSYSSTSMGMGAGGPLMGYGGMFSPVAQASYGPYAGGGRPSVQSTPGYDTQGYLSGNLWGQNTSFFQARPNPMAQLMYGFMGFGGGGLFGGYSGGGYGAPSYSGYGASSYSGYGGGFSPFGGFGGFSGFGGFGGFGGYPTRIY